MAPATEPLTRTQPPVPTAPTHPPSSRPPQAPKYLALTAKLNSKRGGALNPSGCMSPDLGYKALGDGSFAGLPAVMTPAKRTVWIQVGVLGGC